MSRRLWSGDVDVLELQELQAKVLLLEAGREEVELQVGHGILFRLLRWRLNGMELMCWSSHDLNEC